MCDIGEIQRTVIFAPIEVPEDVPVETEIEDIPQEEPVVVQ